MSRPSRRARSTPGTPTSRRSSLIAWIYAQGDWFLDFQGTPMIRKIAGLSLGTISAILPFVLSRK